MIKTLLAVSVPGRDGIKEVEHELCENPWYKLSKDIGFAMCFPVVATTGAEESFVEGPNWRYTAMILNEKQKRDRGYY
jgi:hypothetical protein